MKNRKELEFVLLRYVPHAIRERYVDFGLILREKNQEAGFIEARFAPSWRDVLHLDPGADIPLLEGLEREIKAQLPLLRDHEVFLRWFEDSHSNVIRLSGRRSCWAEDPQKELDVLAAIYLSETPVISATVERKESGRRVILNQMQAQFERVGVWELLIRGVRIADYTRAEDSFKFDFGYHLGDKFKLFHGVSLKASVNAAIEVTSKYKTLSETKSDKKSFDPLLTVIVDDDLNRNEERVSYTLNAMTGDGIQVAELREMPRIAEEARLELGV